jgi:hypothetical protein
MKLTAVELPHVRADRSQALLVVLILADLVVVSPLAELGILNRALSDAMFILALIAGVGAVFSRLTLARLFVIVACGSILMRFATMWFGSREMLAIDAALTLTAESLLALVLLHPAGGRVTMYRVIGAIAVYLLIGLVFAQVYRLLALLAARPFAIDGIAAGYDLVSPRLNYFSFVTLTSLGANDMLAVHPVGRALVVLEALVGILYPPVLIARLVALQLAAAPDPR